MRRAELVGVVAFVLPIYNLMVIGNRRSVGDF